MVNLLKTDILPTTHRRDLPGYEHHDQHNFINEAVIGQHFDVKAMFGAVGDAVTDDATALQDAVDAAEAVGGGIVFIPPGRYLIGDTILVPSRVVIRGAGMYTTKLFAPASYLNLPMFETVVSADVNEFGQSYGIGFENFTIEDRASANTYLTSTGRSEAHHGIKIHEADWGWMTNVNFSDLKGYAIWFSDLAREWFMWNTYAFNCADGTQAAVDIDAATGDPSNTIYFYACRVTFPQGVGVRVDGTIDGIRLINFTDCQLEGGGADSGDDYGTPAPYDIVILGFSQIVMFRGCNFSNPGENEHCINIDGSATSNINRVDIEGCKFNGNASGGAIRSSRCDTLSISACLFEGSTAEEADVYIETDSGLIFLDDATVFSTNEFAGPGSVDTYVRGKVGVDQLSYRNYTLSLPGGGLAAAHQGGASAFLASSAENTMFSFTVSGGAMGTVGGLRARLGGHFNFSGGATTVRVRVKIGGTTVWDATSASLTIATECPWNMEFIWRNIGAVDANSLQGMFFVGNATVPTAGRGSFGTQVAQAQFNADTTKDTTADQLVVVTLQLGAARDNTLRTNFAEIL